MRERSEEKELMDLGPAYYTAQEYTHCMKMLFKINRLFGFFHATVKILRKFPRHATLLDVGCGDGLFLLHLARYFPDMRLTGSDISAPAIQLARQELRLKNESPNISFELLSESQLLLAPNSIDIILTTLMCHHLSNDELVSFLHVAIQNARRAVIINDLHRHSIAYWLYRFISPLLFRNRLITHDGLISIRRGFLRSEWQSLLQQAGVSHYQLKWGFPFRWQLILWKNAKTKTTSPAPLV